MRSRLTLDKTPTPKASTFREFFYARFPNIPSGQWGNPTEMQQTVIERFFTAVADYLDERARK